MKNTKWLLGTFSILLMVSPAGARGAGNEGAQTPASANVQVADIGVVGPGGAVMVFYRDGGDIVVRNCGTDYPKVNQRSDCKVVGKENRVPVEAFKMELKANFLILDPNKLKPLTPAELKAYENGDPNRMAQLAARKEESQKQLDRIQAFIRDRYKGNPDPQASEDLAAAKEKVEKLKAEIAAGKPGEAAIAKVNKIVEDIIAKISDGNLGNTKKDWVSVSRNGDEAFFTVLKQYDASRRAECGTDKVLNGGKREGGGTPVEVIRATWLENLIISKAHAAAFKLEDRLKDCAKLLGSTKTPPGKKPWNLVAREHDKKTGKFYETWLDTKSGKQWGDTQDKKYANDQFYAQGNDYAVKLEKRDCSDADKAKETKKDRCHVTVLEETACSSEDGVRANAGRKDFRLPTLDDFEEAEANGIRQVVPNMKDRWFRSASLYADVRGYARGFSGSNGSSHYGARASQDSVRCVAR